MNFLVVGLGSMGKRRIRCLQALGYQKIYGFDLREDRRKEVENKYNITTFSDFNKAILEAKPKVLIISVPPDVHHVYMQKAVEFNCHFFVEASVVDTNFDVIKESVADSHIVGVPSATMLFHPAIEKISQIIHDGILGKISNVTYHSGQFLPDWHIYEKVNDYYVSNPATGGAREIVPFELTWITKIFGFPDKVFGNFRKTISIKGAEAISDTYNFLLDYKDHLASITIDVVSRYATRRLLINAGMGQLIWSWDENMIKVYTASGAKWESFPYGMASAENGYNPNIGENMYINEIRSAIEAMENKNTFVNSLENDHRVLKLLYLIEQSDNKSMALSFKI